MMVLITGAASGIGLALSLICLQKEFSVIMVDNNDEKLNVEARQLNNQFPNRVIKKTCDLTQADAVNTLAQELYQQISHIDWIFNNAGIIGSLAPLWELTPEQIQQVFAVNIFGMTNVIQAFMPFLFKQRQPSHIINMASLYAICTSSQVASYSMSKHAVLALSESLHFDLQRLAKPIAVSVVLPSFTDTSLLTPSSTDPVSPFQQSLNLLMAHSRPTMDVASQIIDEVEQKKFYIFPDKEVKGYAEERLNAMISQNNPHLNAIEKLMTSLIKRDEKRRKKSS
ncbi:SDR family NAD(P)-dependent oxidoreductase [Legionella sp. km772]|uniref:SDR family NAD(P)-dependent oxidoreductase n=1 Tax=Legionella sp. km772 TaxID=2498111 RepID=UPI0026D34852